MRCCSLLALVLTLCAITASARGANEPLLLKLDPVLRPPSAGGEGPAFITANHLEGKKGSRLEASGAAELRRRGQSISAGHMLYQEDTRDVTADGAVRIEQNGDVLTGMHLEYNLDSRQGELTQAEYRLAANGAHGTAASLRMEGKGNYVLKDVTYTTCPAGHDDWLLKMTQLDLDRNSQIGVAHGTTVSFKGVPLLYSPWMDFPLKGQRKSGVLAPVFGNTTNGGAEFTLPLYLNLAPNYDATVAPRLMAKRGAMFNNEFRYMRQGYYGEMELDTLRDKITQSRRSHLSYKQLQNLGGGFSDTVDVSRVSDDNYYRELSANVGDTSQVNLARTGTLSYGGGWWGASALVQSFQTLQDPLAPVAIPYRRLPQLALNAMRDEGGANIAFAGEYVDFNHPTAINGERLLLQPSVSYPLVSDPGYYITPKFAVRSISYALGRNNIAGLSNSTVNIPIFSVDSGMTFERNLKLGGHPLVQTLEPRAYYVYIPYRNQDGLPNFDSARATFSYAQLFSENRFMGGDRVGDANQVTLAATMRFLDGSSGSELIRAMLGERFSFTQPLVNLPLPPTSTTTTTTTTAAPTQTSGINKSDILGGLSGRLSRALWFDSLVQYNPSGLGAEMYIASARYQPEPGKVLNVGYRFTSPVINPNLNLRQFDISEQWPLWGRWDSVARWNYSILEKRMLEGLLGLEYNHDCWVVRIVLQRFTTSTLQVSTSTFVQLDLSGLFGIGSDPMEALRHSVPGYTRMNQDASGQPAQNMQ